MIKYNGGIGDEEDLRDARPGQLASSLHDFDTPAVLIPIRLAVSVNDSPN